jgi:predicted XRE-type DNA-binding protein
MNAAPGPVSKWVGDIAERRRDVRRIKALLLSRVGWTQQEIADFLDVSQPTIISDVNFNISDNLSEDLLQDALEGLPDDYARC